MVIIDSYRVSRCTTPFKCYIDVHMKMGMCMCAVRLCCLPIQCLGMAKNLATPLLVMSVPRVRVHNIVGAPLQYYELLH